MKKVLSYLLCVLMIIGLLPLTAIQAFAEEFQPYSIDNGYICLQVSRQNGGFTVKTAEGDLLKKSDNNKDLLFHNGEFDTSFVSYQVDYGGGRVEEYIFGGIYGDAADSSRRGVTVSQPQENGEITATWSVGQLRFTQTLSLENTESNEHGMASIKLSASNSAATAVNIKARILLDTCLGTKDYGYYQAVDSESVTHTIITEQILDGASYPIPQNMYATDDAYSPGIIAYSVNNPSSMPYQVAFGHWNNLAAGLFEFNPDISMDFTNSANDYLTADSAYALYYDLGSVGVGTDAALSTYYGVYSRHAVPAQNSVAIDVTVPFRLDLNADKSDYIRLSSEGIADFSAGITFENYSSETAKVLPNVVLAVRTTKNLRPLSDSGEAMEDFDYDTNKPFTITYNNVSVGDLISKTLYFDARICENAAYERITVSVYDVSNSDGELADNYKLGERVIYILLPGADGKIPDVSFSSMTPGVIYSSGTRHLFVTVTNQHLLENRANWNLYAYEANSKEKRTVIPHSMITINDGVMDVAISDDLKLAVGSWYLLIEWTDGAVTAGIVPEKNQKQTAPVLKFVISNEYRYKNDSYGILCVVEFIEHSKSRYELIPFAKEKELNEFMNEAEFEEILLIFRGEFTAEKSVNDGAGNSTLTYYTAVSNKKFNNETRQYSADNTITINGCMDFEGGKMSVYYNNYESANYASSPIIVDFDGELYTSNARTSIYKGKASFTSIVQGTPYSLLEYDKNGERDEDFNDNTIKLLWPSVYGAGQMLAGLLFNLAYGELGVMMDDDGEELGRVLSFSAKLDLSFVAPVKKKDALKDPKFWNKFNALVDEFNDMPEETDSQRFDRELKFNEINKLIDKQKEKKKEDDERSDTATFDSSVMVQDILFGCGKGFVGLHFSVEIGMENFIKALPGISGSLEVNTINDWSFKLEGGMELPTFELEAKLAFKSYNNIPVPDDIYFFIGGFKPGLNIDCHGIIWITGAGGGISNLYDTFFMTDTIPPLKLILSIGLSIMQVLEGKATIALGPTGVSLTGEDIKAVNALTVIEKINLGLEWYPGIDLQASIKVNFGEGLIIGGGYMVLQGKEYTDWLFEACAKVNVAIPPDIPIVGGLPIVGMNMGLSSEKMWGAANILKMNFGISYYWGEKSVNFGEGVMIDPTFPSLLGCDEDIPMYYDEKVGKTLYAHIGTNLSKPVSAEIIDLSHELRPMSSELNSDAGLKLHRFNLGEYGADSEAALVQVNFDASSREDAQAKADTFRVNDSQGFDGMNYPVILYTEETKDTANANVTFNSVTGKATYCFSITDEEYFDKDWYISTGDIQAEVLLYDVGMLPEINSLEGIMDNGQMEITWDGSRLEDLDKISFYLSDKGEAFETSGGRLLATVSNSFDIEAKTITFDIPADLPSGEYTLRAVYSKDGELNDVYVSESEIIHSNEDMPEICTVKDFRSVGNLEYQVTIDANTDEKTDGYSATVYDAEGNPTEISGLKYERNPDGDTVFTIGGTYESEGVLCGLKAGEVYSVGIKSYNVLDTDDNGKNDTSIYAKEVMTEKLELPERTTPTVSFIADVTAQEIPHTVMADTDNNSETPAVEANITRTTFTSNAFRITASITENSTGEWTLDDTSYLIDGSERRGQYGSFLNTNQVVIPLTELTDGSHMLKITGKDNGGDRFSNQYFFDVDTTAPLFILSAPVNGSMFNKNGTVIVSGLTDSDARFTVTSDGAELCSDMTVSELGGTIDEDGVFSFTLSIENPNGASERKLSFEVSDTAGNTVVKDVSVTHGGLASLKGVQILVDNENLESGNLSVGMQQIEKQLSLGGVTEDGTVFLLSNDRVNWLSQMEYGTAEIDENGKLTLSANAQGMVSGQFEVEEGAYHSAALCIGANVGNSFVAVSSALGGTVTGGGEYRPGETVTLIATADNGYNFTGWSVVGATVSDLKQNTIAFTMPNSGNVTATAVFKAVSARKTSSGSRTVKATQGAVKAGTVVSVDIPENATLSSYVPYYVTEDNTRIYVPFSAVVDNQLVFVAPADGQYMYEDNGIIFTDTEEHWAKDSVEFITSRGIFKGIEEGIFAPDESMSRAMFVTVLHRMEGEPQSNGASLFADVKEDSWYSEAVAWGTDKGIVQGVDEEYFAPNEPVTREQMCTLIVRYMQSCGFELPSPSELTFTDTDTISKWATEAVGICVEAGFTKGYPNQSFMPKGTATRGENSEVLKRVITYIVEKSAK